jgi:hypothetical protein
LFPVASIICTPQACLDCPIRGLRVPTEPFATDWYRQGVLELAGRQGRSARLPEGGRPVAGSRSDPDGRLPISTR